MLRCMKCFYHLSQLRERVSIPKCERELQEFLFLNKRVTRVSAPNGKSYMTFHS
jgi:hypothetical protein